MPSGYRKDGTKIIPPSSKGKKWPNRKRLSEEIKRRYSEIHKKLGHKPPSWKGKKRSPENIRKLIEANKGIERPYLRGEKNGMWKGGTSLMQMYRHQLKVAGRPKPEFCEICGDAAKDTKRFIHFDHDHQTGKFRGWICFRCNTALGMVRDNINTLQALIDYLLKNQNNGQ